MRSRVPSVPQHRVSGVCLAQRRLVLVREIKVIDRQRHRRHVPRLIRRRIIQKPLRRRLYHIHDRPRQRRLPASLRRAHADHHRLRRSPLPRRPRLSPVHPQPLHHLLVHRHVISIHPVPRRLLRRLRVLARAQLARVSRERAKQSQSHLAHVRAPRVVARVARVVARHRIPSLASLAPRPRRRARARAVVVVVVARAADAHSRVFAAVADFLRSASLFARLGESTRRMRVETRARAKSDSYGQTVDDRGRSVDARMPPPLAPDRRDAGSSSFALDTARRRRGPRERRNDARDDDARDRRATHRDAAARDDDGRDDDDGSKSSTGARARTIDDDDDAGAGNVRGRDHRR